MWRPSQTAAAFVGRQDQLSAVIAAIDSRRSLVLVDGEAGIGKSRLVDEALGARSVPGGVLHTRCPPLHEPFPLGPLVDALHGYDLGGAQLSPLAGALRPIFPEWNAHLPPALEPLEDPRATRHRLCRSLCEVVTQLAFAVVVIEDAHWADASTLEFLILLITSVAEPPTVIITYRRTDVMDGSLLLSLTSRSIQTTPLRITLEPLDRVETRQLVCATFDTTDVSDGFVDFLQERTDGLPLALEESLSLLRDRGDIVWRAGGWTRRAVEDLQVPPTVRDSVLERVQRLPVEARSVLEASAVLAAPAQETLLGHVADLDPARTRAGVTAGLTAGLLGETQPGWFGFRHVLAAQAVQEATSVSELRHRHQRAAAALRLLDPPPVARLSRHGREAGDWESWSVYGEAAADLALVSGDDHTAVMLLLELVTATDHPADRRGALATKLGGAATWGMAALGDLGTRVTAALSGVLDDGLPEGRGEVQLLLGRLLLQLGEFDAAAEQIEVAVDGLVGQPELAARATISLAWPRGTAWSAAQHLHWLRRSGELYPEVPGSAERTWLDVDRASVLMMLGDEQGWQNLLEIRDRSLDLDGRRQVARGLMNLGHVGVAWGRDDDSRKSLGSAAELMRSTGYDRLLNSALLTTAYLDWHAGRWDSLDERVRELAEVEDTLPEARLEARHISALMALVSGDRARAEAELLELLDETGRRGVVDAQLSPAAQLARLALADDQVGQALAYTEPAMRILVHKGMWLWGSALIPRHVEALVRSGSLSEAGVITAELGVAIAGRNVPAPAAALLSCRASLAEADCQWRAAAEAYGQAADAWSRMPRPYDELLNRERQGRNLIAGQQDQEATLQLLGEVQQRMITLGARWDADRVAQLLRQHGVEVARAWRGGRRGYGQELSPRELEVARLVARGMTNRQAAESLFLSPRTVDRHLSAAMRKLGVSSRTALALAASETGLL